MEDKVWQLGCVERRTRHTPERLLRLDDSEQISGTEFKRGCIAGGTARIAKLGCCPWAVECSQPGKCVEEIVQRTIVRVPDKYFGLLPNDGM